MWVIIIVGAAAVVAGAMSSAASQEAITTKEPAKQAEAVQESSNWLGLCLLLAGVAIALVAL